MLLQPLLKFFVCHIVIGVEVLQQSPHETVDLQNLFGVRDALCIAQMKTEVLQS